MSDNQNSKVYPLKMDSNVYLALQKLCKAKGITVKEGLRTAIGLFLADNINLLVHDFEEIEKAPTNESRG